MVLIGLLLAAIGVAVVTDVIVQNTATIQVHSFGHVFSMRPGVVMLIGAGAGIVVVIGLTMISSGMGRRRRIRSERRTALRERDQLAAQVEEERAARQRAEEAEATATMAAAQASAQSANTAATAEAARSEAAVPPATAGEEPVVEDVPPAEPVPVVAGRRPNRR
jgi:uncharacterized integral membrane protein